VVEKIPGWVERMQIPTLESRVRAIVKEELGHFEKTMNARFEAMDARFVGIDGKFAGVDGKFEGLDSKIEGLGAKLDGVVARIDSLEKRIPMIQGIADLKARLALVETELPDRSSH